MTHLPTEVAGRWFHLFLITDLYSRKIIGREVPDGDSADHAARLVQRTSLTDGMAVRPGNQRCTVTIVPCSRPPRCWRCRIGWASTVLLVATCE